MTSYKKNWNPASYYKSEKIANEYDRKRFSSLAGRVFNWLEKRLIRKAFAGIPAGATIGDVPCGTGRLAEVLLDQGYNVVGVDISQQMLQVAQARLQRFGPRFQTKECNAQQLEQAGLRFEAALCARVLMHFPLEEQIVFLRSVAAVTEGRVVFTQSIDTPYHGFRRLIKRLLRNQAPASFPLTRRDLKKLIDQAGLKEKKRYQLLPLVSEALIVITEHKSDPAGRRATQITH